MPKFKKSKRPVPKYLKTSKNTTEKESSPALAKAKKNIIRQASLAVLTIILAVVLIFSMSAAWYTNIIQTSGLVFQVESWGFEGEIVVNEDSIIAAPGDDGLVHLEVENAGDSMASISVNVSKAGMAAEMQQRLFFYVDATLSRNDETMNRVYLNNREGYTYTVFNNSSLTLTEDRHNDAQLKWHWVYDVLGYYVLGKYEEIAVVDAQTQETTITPLFVPDEYLRPIEYSYDEATTTMKTDENGNVTMEIATVDGETSVEDFLVALSKTDGYAGEIDPDDKNAGGYYPVDVDEDGYGVYAYLCNFAEIEKATTFDTDLGQIAYDVEHNTNLTDEQREEYLKQITYTATLTLSAQKDESITATVSTLIALQEAIAQNKADVIQLNGDITITAENPLVIPENARVMIDLNGKCIHTTVKDGAAIDAQKGSTLTIINGTIDGAAEDGTSVKQAIHTTGAEVMLSKVDIENCDYGVYVGDNESGNDQDSRVHMLGCDIDANTCAVFISGNGSSSEQLTQLVVEKCTISSNGIAISGNGSEGRWGTDVQIIDSTVTSSYESVSAGIYQPQRDSVMTIYNSTVTGYTGIAIKGGSVSIIDSTIKGIGAKNVAAFGNSGFADTGDAVYIETNYGYEIRLDVSGDSVLTSDDGYALQVYESNASNVAVVIYSGTFDEEQPDAYIAEGSVKNGTIVKVAQ